MISSWDLDLWTSANYHRLHSVQRNVIRKDSLLAGEKAALEIQTKDKFLVKAAVAEQKIEGFVWP